MTRQHSSKVPPAVVNGRFNYSECYSAFLKDTSQTKDTVDVVRELLARLNHTPLFSPTNAALNIADIGCNDSRACLEYLAGISPTVVFDYCGIDLRRTALTSARKNLRRHSTIRQFRLVCGDAFNGRLRQRKPFRHRKFDLIFVSHSAYYVRHQRSLHEKIKHADFLEEISNMLSENGIAIILHGNSFVQVRKQFGAPGTRDTPALLSIGATLANLDHLPTLEFSSALSFGKSTRLKWDVLACIELYLANQHDSVFVDALEKLSFIIHQDLTQLAKKGLLPRYIDHIKNTLEANNGHFPLRSCMHVITSPKCSFRGSLSSVIQDLHRTMPQRDAFSQTHALGEKVEQT